MGVINIKRNILVIDRKDNVAVALEEINKEKSISWNGKSIKLLDDIETGHKIALCDVKKGSNIIKYGFPIGHAKKDIIAGEHIHIHNIESSLKGLSQYEYHPVKTEVLNKQCGHFSGYLRENGDAGVRNEIWILPTVGCVNKTAEIIAASAMKKFEGKTDGIFAFTHPFGCSQYGQDLERTRKLLVSLTKHPNAAGVLILGLGCEFNHIEDFKKALGDYNPERVKFLNAQDVDDEIFEGVEIAGQLVSYAQKFKRTRCPLSKLVLGLKCGGSDAFSGIIANPVIGKLSDIVVSCGGTTMITETSEMFGAEPVLFNRCVNRKVFEKAAGMLNGMRQYFIVNNIAIYKNPSYGNLKGGITTLEEKSLGCVQKGGRSPVVDMLDYAERVKKKGFNLLNGPSNDLVSVTNLAAAGAQIVIFSTGRGTPFGGPVPTVKVSTNTSLYKRKPGWIDFDAGSLLCNNNIEDLGKELFEYIINLATGKEKTRTEINGYREISIFKDGVSG